MRIIFFFAALLTALNMQNGHAYSGGVEISTDISLKDKPATIKVLIAKHKKSALLEAKGCYGVYNPLTQLQLATGAASKRDFVFYRPEGIMWGDRFSDISSIRIVPQDAQSSILVDGIEYRGCVEIHAQKEGLSIINEVDIERYLKSTLTFSFAEEMDCEVLEAVAIAARTHAYYLMRRDPDAVWHIDASDVGYEGNALTLQNLTMHQAIQNTRNVIMTFDGAPFPATWTKDSAGKTADFARVFRKKVKAPHAVATPIAAKEREKHMWFFEISKRELARKLALIDGMQKITDIGLFLDKDSQKVYALRIKNGESTRNIDFFTLQKALGSTSLKSNDFIMELKGDKIYFTGYGEGHGVGMCLLSASYYADKGEKSQEILSHFFPNTQLEHMSN